MILEWFCVAAGGALGSLLRYALVLLQQSIGFMHTTWLVNVVGCFFAGVLLAFFSHHGATYVLWQRLLVVGFLGGFTSFSSFTVEWWALTDSTLWIYPLAVLLSTLVSFASGVYLYRFLGL